MQNKFQLTILTAFIISMLFGCSRLTIKREYYPPSAELSGQIKTETLTTSGFFMNRANNNKLEKTSSDTESRDILQTDLTEDATPARDAMRDMLSVIMEAIKYGYTLNSKQGVSK